MVLLLKRRPVAPDDDSFDALDRQAATFGGQDAGSVDGVFQVDTRMSSLGLLAARASGVASRVPQQVLEMIGSAFAGATEAMARDVAAVAQVVRADQAAVEAGNQRDLFEAGGDEVPIASRLRKRWAATVVVIAAAVGIGVVDAQLLRANITRLGMSGAENIAIAYGISATIAVASMMAAIVAAECWARRERTRAVAVFAGTNLALLLLIGVFAYVRAQDLSSQASAGPSSGGMAEAAGQASKQTVALTQIDPMVLWIMFAALMGGTLVLALIKFAMTRPREQWSRDAEASTRATTDTALKSLAEAATTRSDLETVRHDLLLLPSRVLGAAHTTRERANGVSWHYLAELSRSVPVDVAPRVRALPEPSHELPVWTDEVVTVVRDAVRDRVAAIDDYLTHRQQPQLAILAEPVHQPAPVDIRTA